MKKKRRAQAFHALKNLIIAFVSFGFIASGLFFLWAITLEVPDLESFNTRKVAESTKIYDRTGEFLLYDVHQDIKRTVVPFEEISLYAKNATVAIEDDEFYHHIGIRPLAILRAILVQLGFGGDSYYQGQGGSTITQQVVKNTLLTQEKKISRKLKEWVLAVKIERILSKEEILSLYLNEAPYGGNIYGIEEASRAFFGKRAKDLTLAEAAYLAALPQAPTYYSPYGNNADKLTERKNLVLSRMFSLGFISEEEYTNAKNEEVVFQLKETWGIKAPHFVIWVREYLASKYGEDVVQEGGLKVVTTLDYNLQKKAEEIVARYGEENEIKFNARNAGMVGIDPKTGQILVMVGSRDYFDTEHDGNFNIALAHRQPGSAFKPFVYATALMKGYTPETIVFDLPTQFQTTCTPDGRPLSSEVDPASCYMPENYDHLYRGPITFRDALAQSVNIPAIKALYLSGIKDSIETARKMGITTLATPERYGLTLVLGGGEVSLLDITSAYSVFANNGRRNPYQSILRVEDRDGNVLEEFSQQQTQAIPESVALQMSDMLSDNAARTPAFGANSPLYFPGKDVAAKTGTTNDYRDAWIVGYTPYFALGAWVGNNDNTSMEKKVAGFVVAPMWHDFMLEVLASHSDEYFKKPPKQESGLKPVLRGEWRGGETYTIDSVSKKLATKYTPESLKQEIVLTDVHNILYWVDKSNPRGPAPVNPSKDPQFMLWETPVQAWVTAQHIVKQSVSALPTEYDDVHTPALSPKITIAPLAANITPTDRITIQTTYTNHFPATRVDFFLNNALLGSSTGAPFSFSFIPSEVEGFNSEQQNTIEAVMYDSVLNQGSATLDLVFNQ